MNSVTLFGYPQSTFVRTVRMTLEEKGVPYVLEPVDIKSPEFRRHHPFQKMPAFRHGEIGLYETSAIARYIDEAFPEPPLQPENPAGRGLMMQWISNILCYLDGAMIRRFVLEHVFPSGADGKPDREKLDAALEEIRYQLQVLDEGLDGRAFLAGETVSLADFFLAPIIYYLEKFPEGSRALEAAPRVTAWHAEMSRRPSYTATVPPPPPGEG